MSTDTSVLIVGAGPVGLLLANLLGSQKIKTLLIEKKLTKDATSRAIGITPPSLIILKKINMAETFFEKGVKIQKVFVHGSKKDLGFISFQEIPSSFPFILSIPQHDSETLLENNLLNYPSVTYLKGMQLNSLKLLPDKIEIETLNLSNQQIQCFTSSFICACDGFKSMVRTQFAIPFKAKRYKDTFLMGDYVDKTLLGDDAHLFFTYKGSVESFPLPEKKRRWIIQTASYLNSPPAGFLEQEILERSGILVNTQDQTWQSPFGTQHCLSQNYYNDRIFFAGDSAHIMSPIGGQGMNTGFGDAEFLAFILPSLIQKNISDTKILNKYQYYRKKAAKTAIRRARISMNIGTIKGRGLSWLRNFMIYLALHSRFKRKIPVYFSMLTIPFNRLDKVLKKEKSLFD